MYRIHTIKVMPDCCDPVCLPSLLPMIEEPVANPKLFAQAVLSGGAEVFELGVDPVPQIQHGDNPMLLWDISGHVRGMTRVFGWLNADGFAEYMGARRAE